MQHRLFVSNSRLYMFGEIDTLLINKSLTPESEKQKGQQLKEDESSRKTLHTTVIWN